MINPKPKAAPIIPKFLERLLSSEISAIYAEAVVILAPVIPEKIRPTKSQKIVGAQA